MNQIVAIDHDVSAKTLQWAEKLKNAPFEW